MEDSLQQIHQTLQEQSQDRKRESTGESYRENCVQPASLLPQGDVTISLPENPEENCDDSIAIFPMENFDQNDQPDLPPPQILEALKDMYFQHGHSWMNILDASQFERNMFNPDQTILLHALVVFGFKYWTDSFPDSRMRQQYTDRSREKILSLAVNEISFPSAQALAFLAFDALGQGPSSKTLNVMSLLTTAIGQLGLVRAVVEDNERRTESPTRMVRSQVHECRPRENETVQQPCLFWTVYVLDRIIGVSHGFECRVAPNLFRRTVVDKDEVLTPARRVEVLISDVRTKTGRAGLSKSFCLLVEISTLIERVNEFIMRPVNLRDFAQSQEWKSHFRALDAALCSWKEAQLATQQESLGEFDPVLTTCRAIFHTAIIRLQSVAAFPPKTYSHFSASSLAPSRCEREIQSMCRLCESLQPSQYSSLGPLLVFAVWVAARNMVTLWTSGWEERTSAVPPELTTLRETLCTLAEYWPCAQRFTAMIDLAVDAANQANELSTLAIFNDVSKTAFGLQNVLGPRIQHNQGAEMAQLWDLFSLPGIDGNNSFF
ncbi:unnamed protein product [Clonostachys byssicola]|uniref:Xylanolytic transcriptional activator regulatory domain-containing protein n=1 Tax=Clonostachys byssicola TaxID=160290 RepID=A0A9N9UHW6_9HYPO|nr:unnamed protein product [Clonostachys byssicola]